MVSQTVYFMYDGFTLTSQMYHRISVLVPVLVRVPEYLPTSTSTIMSTITLELTSTSKVQVPEIRYPSTASTSTEYEYPSPAPIPGHYPLENWAPIHAILSHPILKGVEVIWINCIFAKTAVTMMYTTMAWLILQVKWKLRRNASLGSI